MANDDGLRFPAHAARSIADGAHPVRAWRDSRSVALQALADAAGVSRPFLNQIEGCKRGGTAATLGKLAAALGVPLGVPVARARRGWTRPATIPSSSRTRSAWLLGFKVPLTPVPRAAT